MYFVRFSNKQIIALNSINWLVLIMQYHKACINTPPSCPHRRHVWYSLPVAWSLPRPLNQVTSVVPPSSDQVVLPPFSGKPHWSFLCVGSSTLRTDGRTTGHRHRKLDRQTQTRTGQEVVNISEVSWAEFRHVSSDQLISKNVGYRHGMRCDRKCVEATNIRVFDVGAWFSARVPFWDIFVLVHLTTLFVAKLYILSGKTISECCNTSTPVLNGLAARVSSRWILHLDQTLIKFDKTQPTAKTQTTARIIVRTHRNFHTRARPKWRLLNYCTARLHVAGEWVLCYVLIIPYLLLNINCLVISYVNSSFLPTALKTRKKIAAYVSSVHWRRSCWLQATLCSVTQL